MEDESHDIVGQLVGDTVQLSKSASRHPQRIIGGTHVFSITKKIVELTPCTPVEREEMDSSNQPSLGLFFILAFG